MGEKKTTTSRVLRMGPSGHASRQLVSRVGEQQERQQMIIPPRHVSGTDDVTVNIPVYSLPPYSVIFHTRPNRATAACNEYDQPFVLIASNQHQANAGRSQRTRNGRASLSSLSSSLSSQSSTSWINDRRRFGGKLGPQKKQSNCCLHTMLVIVSLLILSFVVLYVVENHLLEVVDFFKDGETVFKLDAQRLERLAEDTLKQQETKLTPAFLRNKYCARHERKLISSQCSISWSVLAADVQHALKHECQVSMHMDAKCIMFEWKHCATDEQFQLSINESQSAERQYELELKNHNTEEEDVFQPTRLLPLDGHRLFLVFFNPKKRGDQAYTYCVLDILSDRPQCSRTLMIRDTDAKQEKDENEVYVMV